MGLRGIARQTNVSRAPRGQERGIDVATRD
jgi:hypothetical protein